MQEKPKESWGCIPWFIAIAVIILLVWFFYWISNGKGMDTQSENYAGIMALLSILGVVAMIIKKIRDR